MLFVGYLASQTIQPQLFDRVGKNQREQTVGLP